MSVALRPARRPGKIRINAKSRDLIGMGMARPQSSAESEQHRPHTSSPRTVTDGRERVTRRQTPCPHRTRTTRSAAAFMSPSDHGVRCRQVPERVAKRWPWTDSLTPVPRESAANPKGRESVSQGPCTDSARTSSRRRAKCALRNPGARPDSRARPSKSGQQMEMTTNNWTPHTGHGAPVPDDPATQTLTPPAEPGKQEDRA